MNDSESNKDIEESSDKTCNEVLASKDSDKESSNDATDNLVNGHVKEEPLDAYSNSTSVSSVADINTQEVKKEIKNEIKEEPLDIKEEMDCTGDNVNSEPKTDDKVPDLPNGNVNSPDAKENDPKFDIHDPSPYLPKLEEFELIVDCLDDLRQLIKKFGPLPVKEKEKKEATKATEEENNESEEEEEEECEQELEENDEKTPEKVPRCEQKLHKALCKLLLELAPWEVRLLQATKRMRKKIRTEYLDWITKAPDYVDPNEEAWISDPEPEPEPVPVAPVDPPSSSSSSEASLDGKYQKFY